MEKKRKFDPKIISQISNELFALESCEFKDLIFTARIGSVEYNIWKSHNNDNKYEVIKLISPLSKTAEKDSHERLSKEEIFETILKKVFT